MHVDEIIPRSLTILRPRDTDADRFRALTVACGRPKLKSVARDQPIAVRKAAVRKAAVRALATLQRSTTSTTQDAKRLQNDLSGTASRCE